MSSLKLVSELKLEVFNIFYKISKGSKSPLASAGAIIPSKNVLKNIITN